MTYSEATIHAGMAGARVAASHPFMGPAAGSRDERTAAVELAALFYSSLLTEMEKTVPSNDYWSGRGEEVFRSLQINETGRRIASRRGDALVEGILRSMESPASRRRIPGAYASSGAAVTAADTREGEGS